MEIEESFQMQKFEYREMPLPIWKEVVTFVQDLDHLEELSVSTVRFLVAKELGYEIDSRDVALAAVRF